MGGYLFSHQRLQTDRRYRRRRQPCRRPFSSRPRSRPRRWTPPTWPYASARTRQGSSTPTARSARPEEASSSGCCRPSAPPSSSPSSSPPSTSCATPAKAASSWIESAGPASTTTSRPLPETRPRPWSAWMTCDVPSTYGPKVRVSRRREMAWPSIWMHGSITALLTGSLAQASSPRIHRSRCRPTYPCRSSWPSKKRACRPGSLSPSSRSPTASSRPAPRLSSSTRSAASRVTCPCPSRTRSTTGRPRSTTSPSRPRSASAWPPSRILSSGFPVRV